MPTKGYIYSNLQLFLQSSVVVAVLALCFSGIQGYPYQSSFYFTPRVSYQPLPQISTYYQPLNVFQPSYDLSNYGPFYQPQLPPFFAQPNPSNETTDKPSVEPTTQASGDVESVTDKLTTSETDTNKTHVDFQDFFKKTIISPGFDFIPRDPVFVSGSPVFPQYEQYVVPATPTFNNFPTDQWDSINQAYGLPGFRPFYYDKFLKQLNSTDCNDSSAPCVKDQSTLFRSSEQDNASSNQDKLTEVINKIYKQDPNIVVFNTPLAKSSEDTKTDDELDVRSGKAEETKSDSAFFQAYKDIMFLNKSYLSTVAPYLHK